MNPQDGFIRELEVVFQDGTHLVLSDRVEYSPTELPLSWVLHDVAEVYWAKGDPNVWKGYGNYADHYIVKDCQIYDAESGFPGYHGETPNWRASINLVEADFPVPTTAPSTTSSSTSSSTSTTVGQPTTVPTTFESGPPIVGTTTSTTRPELITNVGTTPIPTITASELPFTGPAFVGLLVTLALLCFGVGFIIRAYYLNWIQKLDQDVKERANAKAKHPSGSLHNDEPS